jgi:hypothetical protein
LTGRANVGIFARALHPVGRGDRLGGAYRGRRYLAISQIGLRASLQLSWRFRIEPLLPVEGSRLEAATLETTAGRDE